MDRGSCFFVGFYMEPAAAEGIFLRIIFEGGLPIGNGPLRLEAVVSSLPLLAYAAYCNRGGSRSH